MRQTYFILTRRIFESEIWRHESHVLKLFIYLVGMARHRAEPKKYPGFEIKRGEHLTSLSEIADNNEYLDRGRVKKWSRQKVARMLKILENDGYIRLLTDTYGTHVRICNYSTYQDPSTYKTDTSGHHLDTIRTSSGQQVDTNNNDNNDNNVNNDTLKAHAAYRSIKKNATAHDLARITGFVSDYGIESVLKAIGVVGDNGAWSVFKVKEAILGNYPPTKKSKFDYDGSVVE